LHSDDLKLRDKMAQEVCLWRVILEREGVELTKTNYLKGC